jgi:spermidine/putrescine transport system substrate-binding protein
MKLQCWEGYERAEFLAPFEQASGVEVDATTLISDGATAHTIASGDSAPDLLNINNAWVRDFLDRHGLIHHLPDQFAQAMSVLDHSQIGRRVQSWCHDTAGNCIGVAQRFGSFNLVVNTQKISRSTAENQGFALAQDRSLTKRFGVLLFDDFNLFHLCIAAGHNPFIVLDSAALHDVEQTARLWIERAALVTDDPLQLNRSIADGAIDFYLSGGVYTASPLRRDGLLHVRGITPASGPIDGKGAIAFYEINSILKSSTLHAQALQFLQYLLSADACERIAMTPNTCNPLVQMVDPSIMARFDRQAIEVMQWPGLDEEIARSADYQLMPSRTQVLEIWRLWLAEC